MIKLRRRKKDEKLSPDEMTMLQHLVELRSRLIKSAYVLVGCVIFVWIFNGPIFDFLIKPYCDLRLDLGKDCKFLAREPLTGFNVQLTVAGYGGFVLAMPFMLYQLARFVTPGLNSKERRMLYPFIAGVVLFLAMGMGVSYWFMPRALDVLVNGFGGDNFEPLFEPDRYLTFFVKMVLAFGVAFQTPVVLVFLQAVGAVKTQVLKDNRRVAVVAVVVVGAVITPTGDPINLAIMCVPMYFFYEASMLIGSVLTRRRARTA